MARTSARDRKRFNWWRTIAIAFAIALHAGIIIMLLAPAAPPSAKKENKQAIVRVQFIPPPPPPPPPEPPKQPPPKEIKIQKPPPMPPPPAPPPPQEQSVMSTPAAPPRPPAPPPPPADVAASIDISYKNRNPPQYPIQAIRQAHQGMVVLDITINAAGDVTDVAVEKSSGYRELDRAAEEAARKWKFNPGVHNGKAAGGVVRVPVNFTLPSM